MKIKLKLQFVYLKIVREINQSFQSGSLPRKSGELACLGWECGESGWECAELGWDRGEMGQEWGESDWEKDLKQKKQSESL